MTVANQFFVYPFAISGDVTTVPNAAPGGGSVSYQDGFGGNYQLPLNSNPDALPINRQQFNQLMQDITSAIAQYQTEGAPDWITTSQNLGSPFPYDIYARVRYNPVSPGVQAGMLVYENQVQGNTATPGADNTWAVISGNVDGVPTGTILDYAGTVVPSGYLAANGQTPLRASFPALLAVSTFTQSAVLSSNTSVTGLSDTSGMFIGMPIEGSDIQAGTTVASIVNSTSITISLAATGSITTNLTFFPWGNGNGSTTFTVPNLNGMVTAGANGATTGGSVPFTAVHVGQSGGEMAHAQQSNEVAQHTHNVTTSSWAASGSSNVRATNNFTNNSNVDATWTTTGGTGSSTPANVMQPTTIVSKIIKT